MKAGDVRFAVVGGGITGLAAAHRLCELVWERGEPPSVLVLEASGRAGGLIRTERAAGILLEGGADSFLVAKPEAPGLLVAGGAVGVPDCIRSGERAAEQAFARGAEASLRPLSARA
ncbi:MAG: FAD-dependent oxidoreductase [Candidatus Binatia bacterium]